MHESTRSLERLYPPTALDHWVVAEPEGVAASQVPEKLVCCLWFESRWRPERLENRGWP